MFIQTPSPALRINGTLAKGNYPNKIILHHPEYNGTPQQLNEMEISNSNDPMIMSGYNFYVRKDGSTYAMRPVWAIGANCYGQNACSIGVCAEGNFDTDIMSTVQEDAIINLCRYLKQEYPITEVNGHSHYYNTDCPGKNYPLTSILNSINGANTIAEVIENMDVLDFQRFFNVYTIPGFAKLTEDGQDGPKTQAARAKLKAILTYILK